MARLAVSFNDMAESLSRQITQLEEFGNLQRRFTSDVSHELRTPLTTVRMAADLIYDHSEDAELALRRSTELMVSELDRFETLLNDLVQISRHDAGVADYRWIRGSATPWRAHSRTSVIWPRTPRST